MPEELELELDESFGELLSFTIIDENEDRPMLIGKLRKNNVDWLIVHRMYIKGDKLKFGKGIRLCIDTEESDLVILAMQSIALDGEILDDA